MRILQHIRPLKFFAIKEKHFFKKSNKQTKNPQNKTNRDSIILPLILTALFMLISALLHICCHQNNLYYMRGSVQRKNLFLKPGHVLLSPFTSFQRGHFSMVQTWVLWRWSAIPPFVIFCCRRSPLSYRSLCFLSTSSATLDAPDSTGCKPMSCTDHCSSVWPPLAVYICWASLQAVVCPVKPCLPSTGNSRRFLRLISLCGSMRRFAS